MYNRAPLTNDNSILERIVMSYSNPMDVQVEHTIDDSDLQLVLKADLEQGCYFRAMQVIWSTPILYHQFENGSDFLQLNLECTIRKCNWLIENAYPHAPLMFELGLTKAHVLLQQHLLHDKDQLTRNEEMQALFIQVCQIFMDADFLTRLACENTNDTYLQKYDGSCRKTYSMLFDKLVKSKGYHLHVSESSLLQHKIMSSRKRIVEDIHNGRISFPSSSWVLSYGSGVNRGLIDHVCQEKNEALIIEKYLTKLKDISATCNEEFSWSLQDNYESPRSKFSQS